MDIFEVLRQNVTKADMVQNSQHCAAVVQNGKILTIGYNRKKTHPLQKKFQNRPERLCLHAEIDAISKIKRKHILNTCDLYILRLSKGGTVSNSEPCDGCKKAIKFFNIKRVYWTE